MDSTLMLGLALLVLCARKTNLGQFSLGILNFELVQHPKPKRIAYQRIHFAY